jgi:hypothetical protein
MSKGAQNASKPPKAIEVGVRDRRLATDQLFCQESVRAVSTACCLRPTRRRHRSTGTSAVRINFLLQQTMSEFSDAAHLARTITNFRAGKNSIVPNG